MSLNRFEDRAYAIAEAAATGVVEPGMPIPCADCAGAGMVPSEDPLPDGKPQFVAVRMGVVYCSTCGASGENKSE